MKELRTGTILLTGKTKDGVYEWPTFPPRIAFSSTKTSASEWHRRLGHPTFSILKHIMPSNNLGSGSSVLADFSCNACLYNKSHKLSFSKSTIVSTQPLETIFSDVWTSPILSTDGFKYYVIFFITSLDIYGFTPLNKNLKSYKFS